MKKFFLTIGIFFSFLTLHANEGKPIGWAENYFADTTSVEKKADRKPDAHLAGKEISTYLIGAHISVAEAKSRLKEAGFDVIAEYEPIKGGTTLVFTNEALKAEGAKPGRAHAATLRLFVDDKEKMISITNPVYFGKAFMQDDYNYSLFAKELVALKKVFGALKDSADALSYEKLAEFHFMMGMPYYEDADSLGEGSNGALLAKAKKYKKGKLMIFELKLSDNSTLIGYDLGRRTKKFVKKIGRANAAILPWCISIENGKATALNAKYYIAISYPLLNMGQFMGIATVPGAITKELEKPFK